MKKGITGKMPGILVAFLSILALAVPCRGEEKDLVFIVHSYEQNHVCGQPQADGMVSILREAGIYPGAVDIQFYYMDTKRKNTSPEQIARVAKRILKKINEQNPDVVVTLDDNAFRSVGLALVDRDGISVVFSGMNGQPEKYNKRKKFMESRNRPGHNVTGIYEHLHLKRALTVFDKILPDLTRVVGITDYSPTGEAILEQFKLEAAEGLPVEWEVRRVKTFSAYQKLLEELNRDSSVQAIYPAALTLQTPSGRVTAPEIFAWTIAHSAKPEIALNYYFSKLGLFGGAAVDFHAMGQVAGKYVFGILAGKKAGDMPIVNAPDYALVFNLARAQALGLTIPGDILLAADKVYKQIPLQQSPACP